MAQKKMMTTRLGVALILAGLVLAGCGSTREGRALSGGAIGAGAGGAFTNPSQIDLGKPVWQ